MKFISGVFVGMLLSVVAAVAGFARILRNDPVRAAFKEFTVDMVHGITDRALFGEASSPYGRHRRPNYGGYTPYSRPHRRYTPVREETQFEEDTES